MKLRARPLEVEAFTVADVIAHPTIAPWVAESVGAGLVELGSATLAVGGFMGMPEDWLAHDGARTFLIPAGVLASRYEAVPE